MSRCLVILLGALLMAACSAGGSAPGAAAPDGSSKPSEPPRSPAPVAALGSPSPSPSPSPVPLREATIRLAAGAASASQWQFLVADRKGFYQKWALKVEAVIGQSNAAMVESRGTADAMSIVSPGFSFASKV